jgi:hypothetical protein
MGPANADLTPVGVERKTLVAATAETPPVIDGDLSDAVWQLAQPSGGFVVESNGRPAAQPTEIRALSDAETLYLAVVCREPLPERLRASVKEDNKDIWGDDCIEFNLDPTGASKGIYQIRVNSAGAKEMTIPGVEASNFHMLRAAAQVGAGEWRFELAVPFRSVGISRSPLAQMRWRINFERLRTVGGDEDDDWQYTAGDWANPDNYGYLVIPGSALEVAAVGLKEPALGPGNESWVAITELAGKQGAYACELSDAVEPSAPRAQATLALAPRQTARADLTFGLRQSVEGNRLRWQVTDATTGALLYAYERAVSLPDVMRVRVQAPRYRGYVFPGLKQIKAKVSLYATPQGRERMALRARIVEQGSGQVRASKEVFGPSSIVFVDLPAAAVGERPCRLEIAVVDRQNGEQYASDSFALRRLSAEEVKALDYYIDDYGRMVHQGKPFLPIGSYISGAGQVREIGESPFNSVLNYGMYGWKDEELRAFLDTAQQYGVHVIFDVNGLYPSGGGTEEEWAQAYQRARNVIAKWKDHPAMMAWYLNDERPKEMVPHLRRFYEVFRDQDPDHPCFIVHFVTSIFPFYAHTCDIFSADPYPIPSSPVTMAAEWTQAAAEAMDAQGAVWTVPQAFAWYQMWEPEDPSLGTSRARTPTANELRRGRAPTYEESRCMTWLSLVHGAKGLIYWAYYNMRQLPQYQEMWAWMQDIRREVQSVEPVILSPKDLPAPTFSPKPKAIHCMAKEYEGRCYLFVVNGTKFSWVGRAGLPDEMRCERATDVLTGETFRARDGGLWLRLHGLGVRVLRLE